LGYCSAKVSTSVTRDIRNDIFEKSQEFSHTEYNKFGISSMITRTTNDAFQIQQFVNILLRTALLTPVMFIISIIMT
ncbi:ABC transporter ATP-binding protein, partial [Clostridioides difficile]